MADCALMNSTHSAASAPPESQVCPTPHQNENIDDLCKIPYFESRLLILENEIASGSGFQIDLLEILI